MQESRLENLLNRLRRYDDSLSDYEDGPYDEEDFDMYVNEIETNFHIYQNRYYRTIQDVLTGVKENLDEDDDRGMFGDDESWSNYHD